MVSNLEIKVMSKEMVNGPAHYGGIDNPYEVIKVCEAWELDKDAYLFNVVKYVAREMDGFADNTIIMTIRKHD